MAYDMKELLLNVEASDDEQQLRELLGEFAKAVCPPSSKVDVVLQKSALQLGALEILVEKLRLVSELDSKRAILKGICALIRDPTTTDRNESAKQAAFDCGILNLIGDLLVARDVGADAMLTVSWAVRWSRTRKSAILNVSTLLCVIATHWNRLRSQKASFIGSINGKQKKTWLLMRRW
jgi:hypothetical protein